MVGADIDGTGLQGSSPERSLSPDFRGTFSDFVFSTTLHCGNWSKKYREHTLASHNHPDLE